MVGLTRYEECLHRATAHASHLRAEAEAGRLNAWAIVGLMQEFLDQPAYAPEHRYRLLYEALGSDWQEWRTKDYGTGRAVLTQQEKP